MRKPYFKKSHQCWYVSDPKTRREIRLDPDEGKAHDIWQRMRDANSQVGPSATYRRLVEEWLSEHYEDRANFKRDARLIASFLSFVGDRLAKDLTKKDVVTWLNASKPGQRIKDPKTGEWKDNPKKIKWGPTTKKVAYNAISRVYRWGVAEAHLAKNPIRGIKLDPAKTRTSVMTTDQYATLQQNSDPQFRQYLLACSCGARPSQVRTVTAANVSRDFATWVFQTHKTSGKTGKPLVVYLTPCLVSLSKILVAAYPSGPLFRNAQGNAWQKDTVCRKFQRLREKFNLPDDLTNYSQRHTFATECLVAGNSLQTTAVLLGHRDARMVSQVYAHLDQHQDYLVQAAASVRTKRAETLQHRKPKAE